MKRVSIALWVAVAVGGCVKQTSTSPPSMDFSIVVTAASENLFLGATQQMTATASDGRSLAGGTWGSDASAVATVSASGLVTAVSPGLANIFFSAEGRQGAKLVRALPNLAGSFSGTYVVTSCSATGQMASANVCSNAPPGGLVPYVFTLSQNGAILSGRVIILQVDALPTFSENIGVDGTVRVTGTVVAPGGFNVVTTWEFSQKTLGNFASTMTQVWTAPGQLTGSATVTGSINSINKAGSVDR